MKAPIFAVAFLALATAASAQQPQLRFDDVVRNLRNPDPKAREAAIRLLREAKYPEAITPMAALVLDPVDDIQLQAIDAELSFFLPDQDVKSKKMIGHVIEQRKSAIALAAFELGPLAVWPRPAPPELVTALLQAIDDENAKVRLEAIYAVGVVATPPLTTLDKDQTQRLIKGLDHFDPAVRTGAALVIARLKVTDAGDALIKAVNDSQTDVRYAAMRALGAIHDESAVKALTEQFAFYRKGEGAWAALDALARIGAGSTLPLFKERLADKDPYIRRAAAEGVGRAGDQSSLDTLEKMAGTDESAMVRMAAAFALQKLGRNYAGRLTDLMTSPKAVDQGVEYLVEIGPSVTPMLLARLQEQDADLREAVADVLGAVGGPAAVPALQAAAAKDPKGEPGRAAKRAVARIESLPSR
jgi:HEAT repeat protein